MAGDVNNVCLQGRLTRDPELRYTPGGTAVCDFRLASSRYYRDSNDEQQEETLFVPVTVWGRQAENCGEYLEKGSQAIITGRLQLDEWETDEGENRSQIKVVANNVRFLGAGGDAPSGPPSSGQSGGQGAPDQVGDSGMSDDDEDDDFSDIPF
jgi:single-strand DNA-binding protein